MNTTRRIVIIGVCTVLFLGIGFFIFKRAEPDTYVAKKSLPERVDDAIDQSIRFLEEKQGVNGSFALSICDNTQPERCDSVQSGPNTAALLLVLSSLKDSRADAIIQKGLPYIQAAADPTPLNGHRIWNIFDPNDPKYGRVPADIDGTVIVSLLLGEHHIAFENDIHAFDAYKNAGGLFYNWISDTWNQSEKERHAFAGGSESQFPDPHYFGVDCVVNADVLSYMASRGKEPPELCSYLNTVIQQKLYPQCAFYYRSPYVLFSTITSAAKDHGATCLEPSLPLIKKQLLADVKEDGAWSQNVFANIVALQTLIRLGERGPLVDKALENILSHEMKDGGWENAVIFPDLYNPVFYGSREMVTAVALKTLVAYRESL